ncbi:MAG: cytochrome c(L), periplasmic [Gammaproteobacteria bacterium]
MKQTKRTVRGSGFGKALPRLIFGTAMALSLSLTVVYAQLDFRHTVTGALLDVPASAAKTPAAKEFFKTGKNPYNGDKEALKKGETQYATSCGGCHGHVGEGKLGPGLADNYWTYPKNKTDKGLFETIWGGAQAMMGPQESFMTVDEMLLTMAWVRELGEQGKSAKGGH